MKGVVMELANVPAEMRSFYLSRENKWKDKNIIANLRMAHPTDINKSAITLERSPIVGSLTAWGTGTVEFIVIDTRTGEEVVSRDIEYTTEEKLRQLLEECAIQFENWKT
jgi:hypothetical protein